MMLSHDHHQWKQRYSHEQLPSFRAHGNKEHVERACHMVLVLEKKKKEVKFKSQEQDKRETALAGWEQHSALSLQPKCPVRAEDPAHRGQTRSWQKQLNSKFRTLKIYLS